MLSPVITPTHWEVTRKTAKEFLNESPNAYKRAEDLLSTSKIFIKKGNNSTLKKARLLELVAITQGFDVTRSTDSYGNKFLQVDHGDDKSTKNGKK